MTGCGSLVQLSTVPVSNYVAPINPCTTPVWHQEMINFCAKPALRGGENACQKWNFEEKKTKKDNLPSFIAQCMKLGESIISGKKEEEKKPKSLSDVGGPYFGMKLHVLFGSTTGAGERFAKAFYKAASQVVHVVCP